jgi:hypothetical protein
MENVEFHRTLKERNYLEDLVVEVRVILKRIIKNLNVEAWIGFIWLTNR